MGIERESSLGGGEKTCLCVDEVESMKTFDDIEQLGVVQVLGGSELLRVGYLRVRLEVA